MVRALTVVNFAIVVGMIAYAHLAGMTVPQNIPLVLTGMQTLTFSDARFCGAGEYLRAPGA